MRFKGGTSDDLLVSQRALWGLVDLGKRPPELNTAPTPIPTPTKRTVQNSAAAARVEEEYRATHAQTQADFAERAHISDRTLRRLLQTNTASFQTWAEVAKAIGTSPEELLQTGHHPAI